MAEVGRLGQGAIGHQFVEAVGALAGWRRHLLAILAGAAASLALPPLHWVLCLWPSFTLFFLLLQGCPRPRTAALLGWSFGFGYFLSGLYWVGFSFFVDAERHALFMPLAVGGLAALLALFTGLGVYLTAVTKLTGWRRVLIFTGCWIIADWLRSWVLSGFPWNFVGTVWTFSDSMIQVAALGGVWLLTVLTVLAAVSPVLLLESSRKNRGSGGVFTVVVHMLLLAAWLGGSWRLAEAPSPGEPAVEGARLRIVQPAIAQELKWRPELRREHVLDQMRLTMSVGYEDITQVIWAETAVPYLLSNDRDLQIALGQVAPPDGYLFTGAPRSEGQGESRRLWNSLHALKRSGELAATFDKFHLVPFGEYDPLSKFLPSGTLVAAAGNFLPGSGITTWELDGLPPVSPLICYEVIFPGAVVPASEPRPGWLLNVTNDAWFGRSTGPYQHFTNARLRAVEEGLPVVRAANTGISAVIDPYGRVVGALELGERGVLDLPLPEALDRKTPFATLGNATVCIIALLIVFLALVGRQRERCGR
jgi:apolipoprotein N-acyltransferase